MNINSAPAQSRVTHARAYGKARLDIARHAQSSEDWQRLWKPPTNPFPFEWGQPWKQAIEYRVDDFAAEVGFYCDVLGLPVKAIDPTYAMFTSPDGDFYLAVVPANDSHPATPGDAFHIQFMLEDVLHIAEILQQRGIVFEQWPSPCQEGSSLYIGYFRTPNGICLDLWGFVNPTETLAEQCPSPDDVSLQEDVHEASDKDDELEADKDEEEEIDALLEYIYEDDKEDGEEDDLPAEVGFGSNGKGRLQSPFAR